MSNMQAPLAGAASDPGQVRSNNEDSYGLPTVSAQVATQRGALYVLCDGMGGHAAGETASRLAVDTVLAAYYGARDGDAVHNVQAAIGEANRRIRAEAESDAQKQGMGSTLVAALVQPQAVRLFNVGDSRAYLLRGDTLRQVSVDHSWVGEQVRAHLLTDRQAREHPMRNIVSRALGTAANVEADVFTVQPQAGDVLLLCCDGVWEALDDEALRAVLVEKRSDAQGAADEIIRRANAAGADDNVTAVVIALTAPGEKTGGPGLSPGPALLVAVAAFVAAALWLWPSLWGALAAAASSLLDLLRPLLTGAGG